MHTSFESWFRLSFLGIDRNDARVKEHSSFPSMEKGLKQFCIHLEKGS